MAINKSIRNLIKTLVNFKQIRGSVLTFGKQKILNCNFDSEDFFKSIGFDIVKTIDINPADNPSYVKDLNYKVRLPKKFDFILDGGTMEHCFNVPQVFSNIVSLLNVGGYILHFNPLTNWVNHSFYQFSPTLYYDFYFDNGFSNMESWSYTRLGYDYGEIFPLGRVPKKMIDSRQLIIFCAKKKCKKRKIEYPVQSNYFKRNWDKVRHDVDALNIIRTMEKNSV